MKKTQIAVIGLGFVGGAVFETLKDLGDKIDLVGIDPAKGFNTKFRDIKDFDGVFVCVPSPSKEDGACDTSILESVLNDLYRAEFEGVVISKVTATPDAYQKFQEKYSNLVHAPEFLTAANALEDYKQGKFAIVGGNEKYRIKAEELIRLSQRQLIYVAHCSIVEASLTKYGINSFLATKVIFMNELAALTAKSGGNWPTVAGLLKLDNRLASSHMQVPGPDGAFGFGGMCFPKDTDALLRYAESVQQELSVLSSAVEKNKNIRSK
jgi:nucleotide sugar dehydrogenase